jgi:hypothetical protein
MPSEGDLSAHVVVAERDTVALKKYIADREARLARTWQQIASRVVRPPNEKKKPRAVAAERGLISSPDWR